MTKKDDTKVRYIEFNNKQEDFHEWKRKTQALSDSLGFGYIYLTQQAIITAAEYTATGPGTASDASKKIYTCLLYTSPSPRDQRGSRMPSSA